MNGTNYFYFFSMVQQPLVGQNLLINEASSPHSLGLLWTNDTPDEETSTWQDKTFSRLIHAPRGFRNRSPRKRAAAELRLRPRGHRDRLPITRIMKLITSNLT